MRGSGGGSSFENIFGDAAGGDGREGDQHPTMHKLFMDAMSNRISLQQLDSAMAQFHRVHLTREAVTLLQSTDASSGKLSFSHFQRAMQQGEESPVGGAGQRTVFRDQASAIISDNCGEPTAPPPVSSAKFSTDISADREACNKRTKQVEEGQARGAFSANPVIPTNRVSAANPLAYSGEPVSAPADNSDVVKETLQAETLMYVSGDISRDDYVNFLAENGIMFEAGSELSRLINAREASGEGKFVEFKRALQRL